VPTAPSGLALPHRRIVERNLSGYPQDTLFVVKDEGFDLKLVER
jgi:hypothetical protein